MKYKNYLLNLIENIPLWYEDLQPNRKISNNKCSMYKPMSKKEIY